MKANFRKTPSFVYFKLQSVIWPLAEKMDRSFSSLVYKIKGGIVLGKQLEHIPSSDLGLAHVDLDLVIWFYFHELLYPTDIRINI